jgi:hypothetical protein
MFKIIFTLFLIIIPFSLASSKTNVSKLPIYGGGMMVSTGFINLPVDIEGLNGWGLGIGGRIYFNIGRYFRLGKLGGNFSMDYKNGSKFEYYYSGFTFEGAFRFWRFTLAPGAIVGWGGYYVLDKLTVSDNGFITAREYNGNFFLISPSLSLEFRVSPLISFTLVADYPFVEVEGRNNFGGPKIAFGIIFTK